jgi:uncharacterized protein YlxW (UPF0749 family)
MGAVHDSARRGPRLRLARPRSLWTVLVPVVCLVAGGLFATSAEIAGGADLRGSGPTDLVGVIQDQNGRVADKEHKIQDLRSQIDDLTAQRAPGSQQLKAVTARISRLAPIAGTESVTGPALTVTLDDAHLSAAQIPQGYTVDDVVVHQQDVQAVVNALWAGGAEAMMLQDQRVVSTSAVRCVGNTLILQGRVYSPPYVISAIGDVQGMEQAINRDQAVSIYRQYVDLLGLGWKVTKTRSATFPAYEGSLQMPSLTVGTGPAVGSSGP